MANVETNIQQRIRLALGTRDDVRLFRNQFGQLPDPRTGRPVQFGLAKGSADIVGWTNNHNATCLDYGAFCTNGAFKPNSRWASGANFNYPESNCCACGKASGVCYRALSH